MAANSVSFALSFSFGIRRGRRVIMLNVRCIAAIPAAIEVDVQVEVEMETGVEPDPESKRTSRH